MVIFRTLHFKESFLIFGLMLWLYFPECASPHHACVLTFVLVRTLVFRLQFFSMFAICSHCVCIRTDAQMHLVFFDRATLESNKMLPALLFSTGFGLPYWVSLMETVLWLGVSMTIHININVNIHTRRDLNVLLLLFKHSNDFQITANSNETIYCSETADF